MANTKLRHVPKEIWWQRWTSLRSAIDGTLLQAKEIGEKCQSEESISIDGDLDTVFQNLLQGLLNFGDQQFPYFYFGFRRSNPDGEPLHSGRSSFSPLNFDEKEDPLPLFVMRRTFDQLASDLELIQRALFSRKYGTEGEKKALCKADHMAMDLLIKRTESPPVKTPRVISYFDEAPHIRILPYADIVLVGVPYSLIETLSSEKQATERSQDFLVLGHEMGHFVFRNLDIEGQPAIDIKKAIETYGWGATDVLADIDKKWPHFITNWLEEIFCDVFGVISTGDTAAHSMATELSRDNALATFYEDTGAHPIAAVRPYTYAVAISIAAQKLSNENGDENLRKSAETLRSVADESLKLLPKKFYKTENRNGEPVQVDIIDDLQPYIPWLVDSIIDYLLLDYDGNTNWSPENIARIADSRRRNHGLPPLSFTDSSIQQPIDKKGELTIGSLSEQDNPKPFIALREKDSDPAGEDKEVWQEVFYADGWAFGDSDARTPITGGFE